ncbi:hypothetical protein JT358_04370 [Micrococcales bacterium 31B]|nr:hypothetical protein [Micrococcales bacterium 31B]
MTHPPFRASQPHSQPKPPARRDTPSAIRLIALMMVTTLVFTMGNVLALNQTPLLGLVPTALAAAALAYVWRPLQRATLASEPPERRKLWRVCSYLTAGLMALGLVLMVLSILAWAAVGSGPYASDATRTIALFAVNGAYLIWPMLVGVGAFGVSLTLIAVSARSLGGARSPQP